MKGSRYRGWLWVFVLLAIAGPAHAAINMTGRWWLGSDDVLDFTQVGTALTQTPSTAGQQGPRTGFIDSTTGAFTVRDPLPCGALPLLPSCELDGTVAADGLTFTGGLACAGGRGCFMPPPEPVMGFRVPPTCGNGVVDPGEQCDNGSNLPESCCDPLCRLVASGTSCGPANCIATHACDGAGTCVTGPPVPCDQCSRCAFGGGLPIECVADPATSCRAPTAVGAAQLILKTTQLGQFKVTKSSLKWKWAKGQATALADFGDPVHADGYSLCLYDVENLGNPATLLHATVSPGTNWRAKGQKGFRYKDKLGVADGVTAVDLQAGADGKTAIVVSAKGPHLAFPGELLGLPVIPSLAVQLRGHGECWGAGYVQAGVKKNTGTEFVAKSSPSGAFLDYLR